MYPGTSSLRFRLLMGTHPELNDVDQHERVVVREMDVDVVRRVVGPVVGQLDPFTADLQRVAVLEGDPRCGPGRVVVPQQ